MKEIIEITCKGEMVPLLALTPIQGTLKDFCYENYEKIKKSMLLYGITFPVFVWVDLPVQTEDQKARNVELPPTVWIIDGHQRVETLKRMAKEGYQVPNQIPCVYVQAKSKTQALEKVLVACSKYGKMTEEGLEALLASDPKLQEQWDELKGVLDLPDFSLEDFDKFMVQDPHDNAAKYTPAAPTHVMVEIRIPIAVTDTFIGALSNLCGEFDVEFKKLEDPDTIK